MNFLIKARLQISVSIVDLKYDKRINDAHSEMLLRVRHPFAELSHILRYQMTQKTGPRLGWRISESIRKPYKETRHQQLSRLHILGDSNMMF
jgi:hypothetical protein